MTAGNAGPAPELGLFVVASPAAAARERILGHARTMFDVRRVYEIRWTPELAAENYARFYRQRPSAARPDADFGRLLVVTAVDTALRDERRATASGSPTSSTKFFEATQQFRAWTAGTASVHASTTAAGAARDLMLLLGTDPQTHLEENPEPWDGRTEEMHRDLSGARGWASPTELFYALNHTVPYVVLRNFEELPHCLHVGSHEDVDMLTGDYPEAIRVMNARPNVRCLPRWGGPYWVNISGEDMWFDVRFVGDRYYDPQWAADILDRRVWNERGFYSPNAEDYFETLAYHAVVHKREFAADYRPRLAGMAAALGRPGWDASGLGDPARMKALLDAILRRRGYRYYRPRDVNVFYNFSAAGHPLPHVRRKLAGIARKALRVRYRVQQTLGHRYWRARDTLCLKAPWLNAILTPTRQG
jgi:hypothetical protein